MKDEKQVTMKNGQLALSWFCTICGTMMFKIDDDHKKSCQGKNSDQETNRKSKGKIDN